MALPRALLLLPLTLHVQSIFGHQLSVGSIELSNLPVQKEKDTDTLNVARHFDSIIRTQKIGNNENVKPNTYYNFNKTETKTNNEAMIAEIQFSRNQIPAITSTINNGNALGSHTTFGHPIGPSISSYVGPKTNQAKLATVTGETVKQTQGETLTEPKSPLHGPNPQSLPFVASPRAVYWASVPPASSSGSFIPSSVSINTVATSSQNQAAHQNPSTLFIRPSNIQSPVRYMQAVPKNVSSQKEIENIVQNGQSLYTPLLLYHILSQSYNTQDSSTPIQTRYLSRDPKQLNNNTLLPLLLQFLKEKNNSDCKGRKSQIHNNRLTELTDGFESASLDKVNSESETSEHIERGVGEARSAREDDDDYSDENSDYSTENYNEDQ